MTIWVYRKELIDYTEGLDLMHKAVEDVMNNFVENTIFLLEHRDVFTVGASLQNQESPDPSIPLIHSSRGGKITYHGPGQRVIYPIIDLRNMRDIKKYVDLLQEWIIISLNYFDIHAFKLQGYPGVWVLHEGIYKKIASIGIKVRRWVAYHGVAININNNIINFNKISPCGIEGVQITYASQFNKSITLESFDAILKCTYYNIFSLLL